MGSDGASYNDAGTFQVQDEPKIWEAHETFFGCSGNGFTPIAVRDADSGDPLVVARYLKDYNPGGSWRVLMVGRRGVFELDDSGSVAHWARGVGAIGVGEPFALGAMAAVMLEVGPDPVDLVKEAMKLAVNWVTECRGPVTILSWPHD